MMFVGVRLKEGASIKGIKNEMLFALLVIPPILDDYEQECVITSGSDGTHSKNSKHYLGYALDFRSWVLQSKGTVDVCAKKMQEALGAEFYVRAERTHIHVQFNGNPT